MFWQALNSRKIPGNIGLNSGQLMACSGKPNCVSSQADTTEDFFIAPITSPDLRATWKKLPTVLKEMGMELQRKTETYIHATATTPLMRFVDDVEFVFNEKDQRIDFKSESRVGHSDLGTNRKRMEKVRKRLRDTN